MNLSQGRSTCCAALGSLSGRPRIGLPLSPSTPPGEGKTPSAVLDHEPAPEHAAQVREVGHACGSAGDAEHQLERAEENNEKTRLHRDRRGKAQEYEAAEGQFGHQQNARRTS